MAASVLRWGHTPRGSPGAGVARNTPYRGSCTPRGAGSPGSSQEPRTVGDSPQVFLGTEMGTVFLRARPLLGARTSMLEMPCVCPEPVPLKGTTRTCMHAHTQTRVHSHARTLTCMHACTLMHAHIHTCTRTSTHALTHVHVHTHMCTYTVHSHACSHTHTRRHTCMHVHAHTHMHSLTGAHAHMHTHIHICTLRHAHAHVHTYAGTSHQITTIRFWDVYYVDLPGAANCSLLGPG